MISKKAVKVSRIEAEKVEDQAEIVAVTARSVQKVVVQRENQKVVMKISVQKVAHKINAQKGIVQKDVLIIVVKIVLTTNVQRVA